jgi:ribonuclease-3
MTFDRATLEKNIGHRFADAGLLRRALTHASHMAGQAPGTGGGDNERMEFIGDRVLGLAVADILYRAYPKENEGALAKRLTALVQQAALVQVALAIDLAPQLQLSAAERRQGVKEAVLADAVEALIGAVYLDGGYAAAADMVTRLWQELLTSQTVPPEEAKTRLQEWAQARGLPLPQYDVIAQEGPPHAPLFTVRLTVEGQEPLTAAANSKRGAEKAAAAALLAQIDTDGGTPA